MFLNSAAKQTEIIVLSAFIIYTLLNAVIETRKYHAAQHARSEFPQL